MMKLLSPLTRLRNKHGLLVVVLAANLAIAIGIMLFELSMLIALSSDVFDVEVSSDNGNPDDSNSVFSDVDDESPFNLTFEYTMRPNNKSGMPPKMLVLVYTVPSETILRRQIRESWGSSTEHDVDVRVEFLMGIPPNKKTSDLVAEQDQFGDLVLVNFEDTYYNLAVKTFIALDYKNMAYPDAKCFVKADVDNVLMLRNYQTLCDENKGPIILGKCNIQRTVFRMRKMGKWAVPKSVYSRPFYPYYCSTGTYIMVGKTLPGDLQDVARRTKFPTSQNFRRLPEDMLFTGMFPELLRVTRHHVGGMSFDYDADILCRNDGLFTYAIHMPKKKNHIFHYRRLLRHEGIDC